MELGGEVFTFVLNYNGRFDFFTIDAIRDNETLISGEKIVYGKPLFSTVQDDRLPGVDIWPISEGGQPIEAITWENFGEEVLLLVSERDE